MLWVQPLKQKKKDRKGKENAINCVCSSTLQTEGRMSDLVVSSKNFSCKILVKYNLPFDERQHTKTMKIIQEQIDIFTEEIEIIKKDQMEIRLN